MRLFQRSKSLEDQNRSEKNSFDRVAQYLLNIDKDMDEEERKDKREREKLAKEENIRFLDLKKRNDDMDIAIQKKLKSDMKIIKDRTTYMPNFQSSKNPHSDPSFDIGEEYADDDREVELELKEVERLGKYVTDLNKKMTDSSDITAGLAFKTFVKLAVKEELKNSDSFLNRPEKSYMGKCSISAPRNLKNHSRIAIDNISKIIKHLGLTVTRYNNKSSFVDYVKSFGFITDSYDLSFAEYNYLLYNFLNSECKEIIGAVDPKLYGPDEFIQLLCTSLKYKLPTEENTIIQLNAWRPNKDDLDIIKNYNDISKILRELPTTTRWDINELLYAKLKFQIPPSYQMEYQRLAHNDNYTDSTVYPSTHELLNFLNFANPYLNREIAIRARAKPYQKERIGKIDENSYTNDNQKSFDKPKLLCNYCKMTNHIEDNCYRKQNANKPQNTGNARWCNYCKNDNHNDATCFKKNRILRCLLCGSIKHTVITCTIYPNVDAVAEHCSFCFEELGFKLFHPRAKCISSNLASKN